MSGHNPGPMTRTRKARDAQLQLGVGRPPATPGRGPRTRSASIAKGSRSRSGRGAKPVSTPIVEGSSGLFSIPLALILLGPIVCSLYRSVLICFVTNETRELYNRHFRGCTTSVKSRDPSTTNGREWSHAPSFHCGH